MGCIVEHQGRLLLCRRAIQPCRGLWTLPAGYLELGEGSAAGAARETWEEANAQVEVCRPCVEALMECKLAARSSCGLGNVCSRPVPTNTLSKP